MEAPSDNDTAMLALLFEDRTGAIQFAKEQMWDVVKWCISLQIAAVGFATFFPGKELFVLSAVPIVVGAGAATLVYYHGLWLSRGRERLEIIRRHMGAVVRLIYEEQLANNVRKKHFTVSYYSILLGSSLFCFGMIYLLQSSQMRSPNAG